MFFKKMFKISREKWEDLATRSLFPSLPQGPGDGRNQAQGQSFNSLCSGCPRGGPPPSLHPGNQGRGLGRGPAGRGLGCGPEGQGLGQEDSGFPEGGGSREKVSPCRSYVYLVVMMVVVV